MKEVEIPCVGYSIKADWYEGNKDEVLLVLPGFTSTKAKYADMVQTIVEQTGISALVIDYSGHGESPFDINDLTRAQNFAEVIKAYDWLVKNKPNLIISAMGTSYGGFHAANLTKYRELNNIIFRVPASYPEETFFNVIGEMEDAHSESYRNDPANYVDHWLFDHAYTIQGKVFVITHELDAICPKVATAPFIEAFNADHWEAPGFKHGLGQSEATDKQITAYYLKIADWING